MGPETFDKLGYFFTKQVKNMYKDLSPNTQNYLNIVMGI